MSGTNLELDLMEPHQQKVFEMYVHLGPERSLTKLLAVCHEAGITISEPTIKRWSSRYKWKDLVVRTEQEIAARIAREAMPIHVKSMQADLDTIEILKDDFRARVKAGEIKVETLADYALLLKIESQIIGDPTKKFDHGDTTVNNDNRIVINLSPEELERFMLVDAQAKHGLPPAPTYEAEAVNE